MSEEPEDRVVPNPRLSKVVAIGGSIAASPNQIAEAYTLPAGLSEATIRLAYESVKKSGVGECRRLEGCLLRSLLND